MKEFCVGRGPGDALAQRCRQAVQEGTVLDALAATTDRNTLLGNSYGRIPAHVIREVLVGPAFEPDPQGFRIRNAFISGQLNLDHAALKCPLALDNCYFEHPPSFEGMSVPSLELTGRSFVPGMCLAGAVIKTELNLRELRSEGTIDSRRIRAGGIDISGADLKGNAGVSLLLDGGTLAGKLTMRKTESAGLISARETEMDGIDMTEAVLSGADGESLNLTGAKIKGSALLSGVKTKGAVSAFGANMGQLDLTKAYFGAGRGTALELSRASVVGTAFCSETIVDGAFNAADSSFGELILTEASVFTQGDRERALNFARVHVAGSATLVNIFCHGTVFMFNARLGQLDMTGAIVWARDGTAVELSKIDVQGTARFVEMHVIGAFHAADSQFTQMLMSDADFYRIGYIAANFARAKIAGKAEFTGISIYGRFQAQGMKVGGKLDFSGAKLGIGPARSEQTDTGLNPGPVPPIDGKQDGTALDLSNACVTGSVVITNAVVHGTVRTIGAEFFHLIVGQTSFETSRDEPGKLDLGSSSIKILELLPKIGAAEGIYLTGAKIGSLNVSEGEDKQLPPLASAVAWRVGAVHGTLTRKKQACQWMKSAACRSGSFTSQPWKEMARVYDDMGQTAEARWLRFMASREATAAAGFWRKLPRWLYEGFVGYGYYPLLAAAWIVAAWALAFGLASGHAGDFVSVRPASSVAEQLFPPEATATAEAQEPDAVCPNFHPALYAVETAIPPVITGQSASCRVDIAWLAHGFTLIKIHGWICAALLLAGVTGLLRKD